MANKIQPLYTEDGEIGLYMFWCPGCRENHAYTKGRWEFNGDYVKPTFSPSLLYPDRRVRCHLFVTDGRIQYLSDCGHELAGQTIEMEDVE